MTIITTIPETVPNFSYPAAVKSLRVNGVASDFIDHDGDLSPTSIVNDVLSVSSNAPIPMPLLAKFVDAHKELQNYKNGKPITIDGHTLSIPAVAAAARYNAHVTLDSSDSIKEKIKASRAVIDEKVASGTSIYGVSTGFGGSADTRTDNDLALGHALLQHQHVGILPSSTKTLDALPLLDPLASTSMPESWVRGAILIRMNSLIRGHSGVRWELIEKMNELLSNNITPVVPLRGSISASGDLSPLSYIAGTLVGNPSIRVFNGPSVFGARQIVSSREALAEYKIEPIPLKSKEHLGILNGTAFSASVASLALNDAVHLAILAQVCTAMGTEALVGTRGSFDQFIHDVARPHPGQVEVARTVWDLLEKSTFADTRAEKEVSIDEDEGTLRQDRYPLRTAPQFLGPQIEDLLSAVETITIECNSTTDNPLVDGQTGSVHHGGNFQAMSVTNAMEKTRVAIHHIGKLLFAQCTELLNPTMNRGLPPSLAATDPSLNYHAKGLDIATAAYVGELGYLANPVSTHVQSAEMHNQAVNSLALISGRATINSLDVLTILTATYIYILCQALDIRALQAELYEGLNIIVLEELQNTFGSALEDNDFVKIVREVQRTMRDAFDTTSTMDATARMKKVASSSTTCLVDFFTSDSFTSSAIGVLLTSIPSFRTRVSTRSEALLEQLRSDYLSGARGAAPASKYLNRTRPIYEYVRINLGVRMHGSENFSKFANDLGVEDVTIGQNISYIQESIRDGKMQAVVVGLFE